MNSRLTDLISFCVNLRFDDLPEMVTDKTKLLFLDWLGSALGGKNRHPLPIMEEAIFQQGPKTGNCEIISTGAGTSPYFAAFINGASSHILEQDDLHNSSVFHPATVVFPACLAVAQDIRASGKDLMLAAICGYEAGIRIGEFLGLTHYRTFHTTGTVGTLASAFAAAKLLRLSEREFSDAIGNAGTQAAGLWQFLHDAADSKQLHTAKAAADGVLSAYLAKDGFRGAKDILEGEQGMAAGMSKDAIPEAINHSLGKRWALLETSFKFHASCRHTHPAADAFDKIMKEHHLNIDEIEHVKTFVHQAAIDVLGNVEQPGTVHQAKFSMGTVLALLGIYGKAGVLEFEKFSINNPKVEHFRKLVSMEVDQEIEKNYPNQWRAKVEVKTQNGKIFSFQITYPKGDPQNSLSELELEEKFKALSTLSQKFTEEQLERFISLSKNLQILDEVTFINQQN